MEESNTIQKQSTDDNSTLTSIPTTTPEELKREEMRRYYTELQKQNYEKCIEVVMNQTTYTREEAITSLQKHKGNVVFVIKEFLGVPEKKTSTSQVKSVNQEIYKQIRKRMEIMDYNKKQDEKLKTEIENNELSNKK